MKSSVRGFEFQFFPSKVIVEFEKNDPPTKMLFKRLCEEFGRNYFKTRAK